MLLFPIHESKTGTNYIHLIVGDETNAWISLNGPVNLDVSELLSQAPQGKTVIRLSNCESETTTALRLSKSGIQVIPISPAESQTINVAKNVPSDTMSGSNVKQAPAKTAKCTGCGGDTSETLDIPGLGVRCGKCLLIDIGLKRQRDNRTGDTSHDKAGPTRKRSV